MINRINIGVLGCANIAYRSIIPTIKQLKEYFNLIGIASRNENKAKRFASEFMCEAIYGYDKLLEKKEIEAIYIPLPNSMHYHWAKRALNQNLHVLIEKSLACSYDDVIELNRIAYEKNLVLVENFQFRFHKQLKTLIDLVDKERIGKLRCIRSSFGFPPFKNPNDIRYNKNLGGGALLDAGAYPLKISQILLGNDLSVEASSLCIDTESKVDIWGGAFLKDNQSNLFSEIAFGFDNFYQCNLELWGSEGKISTERIFTAPIDYRPKIVIENENERQVIEVESDDHFLNMLKYFHSLVITKAELEKEYIQNTNQARLIEEMRVKAFKTSSCTTWADK